jgi:hypothetical protein
MAFAFEGYATAEFSGSTFSCAGGLAPDLTAYIPALLPNTTVVASPIVRNVLTNPGPDCVVNLGACALRPDWQQPLAAYSRPGHQGKPQLRPRTPPARCHPAVLSDLQAAVADGGHPGRLPGGHARADVRRVPRRWAPRASLRRCGRTFLTRSSWLACVPSSVVWSATHCKLVGSWTKRSTSVGYPEDAQYTSTARLTA